MPWGRYSRRPLPDRMRERLRAFSARHAAAIAAKKLRDAQFRNRLVRLVVSVVASSFGKELFVPAREHDKPHNVLALAIAVGAFLALEASSYTWNLVAAPWRKARDAQLLQDFYSLRNGYEALPARKLFPDPIFAVRSLLVRRLHGYVTHKHIRVQILCQWRSGWGTINGLDRGIADTDARRMFDRLIVIGVVIPERTRAGEVCHRLNRRRAQRLVDVAVEHAGYQRWPSREEYCENAEAADYA